MMCEKKLGELVGIFKTNRVRDFAALCSRDIFFCWSQGDIDFWTDNIYLELHFKLF